LRIPGHDAADSTSSRRSNGKGLEKMRFRPCIDLHLGKVKQIVGGTLDQETQGPATNFESERPAKWYAELYRQDNLTGGHIIRLGSGNSQAARAALAAWPDGMQIGGGIRLDNAIQWLEAGAAAVILTSWVFRNGIVDEQRIQQLVHLIGRQHLVLDLSCRRRSNDYYIVTDRWQTYTQEKITFQLLDRLSRYCSEFLIHAVDVEGRCQGIETPLVALLGQWQVIPITYAGGIHAPTDLETIARLGQGRLDFTVGSALDIFGGHGLKYRDLTRQFGPEIDGVDHQQ
jgi:phosphoribosylformimino-5-aminoimidazole carboxamide ribotide isomerase